MGFLSEFPGDPNLHAPSQRASAQVCEILSDFFRVLRDVELGHHDNARGRATLLRDSIRIAMDEYSGLVKLAGSNSFPVGDRTHVSTTFLHQYWRTAAESQEEIFKPLNEVLEKLEGHGNVTHVDLVWLSHQVLHVLNESLATMERHGLLASSISRSAVKVFSVAQIIMVTISDVSAAQAG
jgi:uncharacterized protein YejL (UPF0352 family)